VHLRRVSKNENKRGNHLSKKKKKKNGRKGKMGEEGHSKTRGKEKRDRWPEDGRLKDRRVYDIRGNRSLEPFTVKRGHANQNTQLQMQRKKKGHMLRWAGMYIPLPPISGIRTVKKRSARTKKGRTNNPAHAWRKGQESSGQADQPNLRLLRSFFFHWLRKKKKRKGSWGGEKPFLSLRFLGTLTTPTLTSSKAGAGGVTVGGRTTKKMGPKEKHQHDWGTHIGLRGKLQKIKISVSRKKQGGGENLGGAGERFKKRGGLHRTISSRCTIKDSRTA